MVVIFYITLVLGIISSIWIMCMFFSGKISEICNSHTPEELEQIKQKQSRK